MTKNLVIVESPAKAKTIEKFLGKDYTVRSCFGHIRDLAEGDLSVDVDNNFEPHYVIPEDKKKVVSELKKLAKTAEVTWLATDEDREGEAISWHLAEALDLSKKETKRIVFHEITKPAILNAIKHPRFIDENLVNAQQARRILDRLVGFELSPILWKKVKPSLSAGRVQSVAVRLIVEREREINNFKYKSAFKITANFHPVDKKGKKSDSILKAELPQRFETKKEALAFLNKCNGADFSIADIEVKPGYKSPAAPFTTSTLQQEASRKLGFSVTRTMVVAQKLYESGHITYMRTDSVNLSEIALAEIEKEIVSQYGKNYSNPKKYTTKSSSAQEAHEAIRPTYITNHAIEGDDAEKRLYDLIWKRTIASQMANAKLERTNVKIEISKTKEQFQATGEVLIFDGFLKVYLESRDDEDDEEMSSILPPLSVGQELSAIDITATQRYNRPQARYTEASLVRQMEELGIGRPSTYAPTITTIQKRDYVNKTDQDGEEREFTVLTLANAKITDQIKKETFGKEKGKLFPSNIGMLVNDFLLEHFESIMDYSFTANVEKEFDEIADGNKEWHAMLKSFYKPFHKSVEKTIKNSKLVRGERLLGVDKESGKNVYAKMGKFGPHVQIGEMATEEEKPRFAKMRKGQLLENITLEEAMELFRLPRELGQFEGESVVVNIGRFGPYIAHNKVFYSLPKDEDPYIIPFARTIEIIESKKLEKQNKTINEFDFNGRKISVLNGRFGPYINFERLNVTIPKAIDPKTVDLDKALELIEAKKAGATTAPPEKAKSGKSGKSAKSKKGAPKKEEITKAVAKSIAKTAAKKKTVSKSKPAAAKTVAAKKAVTTKSKASSTKKSTTTKKKVVKRK